MRVVSIAANIPGPLAASKLARDGASVLKIEPPNGDALALGAPAWYAELIEKQEVLKLDLRDADARARLQSYLARADVFLTSSRPSSLAKLGFDPISFHASFPMVCWVAIVGEPAPHSETAGHDLTYQAKAGLLATREMPAILLADLMGAQRTVSCVYRLLFERERSGVAGYETIALSEGLCDLSASIRFGLTSSGGMLGGGSPFYNIYRAADGWIAIAAIEPQFRDRLLHHLGLPNANRLPLEERLAAHSCAHWESTGRAIDVPIAKLEQL